jgi:hypothetical protein
MIVADYSDRKPHKCLHMQAFFIVREEQNTVSPDAPILSAKTWCKGFMVSGQMQIFDVVYQSHGF